MAVIAIIMSSAVAILAALIHFVALDGTVLQAIATYFTIAIVGSMLGITLSLLRGSGAKVLHAAIDEATQWDEWHEDEDWQDAEIEARHESDAQSNRRKSA